MKKSLLSISAILLCSYSFSQVGINTPDPKSTLDIKASATNTSIDGLIAPRLTRAQLSDKGDNLYGTDQNGAIVYITDVSGGINSGQRSNITEIGYYTFDYSLNKWVNMSVSEPWRIENSIQHATSNTQNIYQTGFVGIGDFTSTRPVTNLHVKGETYTSTKLGVGTDLYFNSNYAATPDAIIKRTVANNIQVESALTVANNGGSAYNFRAFDVLGDAQPTFTVNKNGVILLGSRTATPDVRISRGGANWLRLQDVTLSIARAGAATLTPGLRLSSADLISGTNPYPTFEIMVSGKLRWGIGGGTEPDLSLERDASGKLRLEGPAYDGATGVRYLVYNTANKLLELSSAQVPTSQLNDRNQADIEDLRNKIIEQNERINQLENLLRSLSSQTGR